MALPKFTPPANLYVNNVQVCSFVAFITTTCYVMFSCSSNMNSFIGLVFFHDLCICVTYFLHFIALYFVFRLYDSALAIILLKAT